LKVTGQSEVDSLSSVNKVSNIFDMNHKQESLNDPEKESVLVQEEGKKDSF